MTISSLAKLLINSFAIQPTFLQTTWNKCQWSPFFN